MMATSVYAKMPHSSILTQSFLPQICITLISWGHDVLSAVEIDPALDDETLLAIANEEWRIMLTEDKDFGKLVFARGLPHRGVIRFVDMNDEEKSPP